MAYVGKKERKDAIRQRFIDSILFIEGNNSQMNRGDIATELDISQQSLTEIMYSRQFAGAEILQRLFEQFGISSDYIFFGILPIKNGNTPLAINDEDNAGASREAIAPTEKDQNARLNARPTARAALKNTPKSYNYSTENTPEYDNTLREPPAEYGTLSAEERLARLEQIILELKQVFNKL